MMKKVILQAEASIDYKYKEFNNASYTNSDLEKKALIGSAIDIADALKINSIVIFTKTGKLAKIAAAYKSKATIYAFTNVMRTVTNTTLLFGIRSKYIPYDHHADSIEEALKNMIAMEDIGSDEKTIIITDIKRDGYEIPTMEIINVKQFLGL
jgi:pyruvate kinase